MRRDLLCIWLFTGSALLLAGAVSCDEAPSEGWTYSVDDAGNRVFASASNVMAEYITSSCSSKVNCLLPCPQDDLYVAINPKDYQNSQACGACMQVTGPRGSVMVKVIENCASACADGEIELSKTAFSRIADVGEGRATVSWKIIPCQISGPISFHFEKESTQWWVSIQVRDHLVPVAGLAVLWKDGSFKEMTRKGHNYFEIKSAGAGPFSLRVRSVDGQELTEKSIPLSPGQLVTGKGQFK